MEKNKNNQINQEELKVLEAKLNEKIARAEKLEKSLKQAQKENRERVTFPGFAFMSFLSAPAEWRGASLHRAVWP